MVEALHRPAFCYPSPGPIRAAPQQRRPLLAAAGSLPSPAGYCSAPATPQRCCIGAVRHAPVAGGFFPSAGLRNATPAKLKVFTLLLVLSYSPSS